MEGRDENLTTGEVIMIILSGNCPRHHNAIMLELTDFDDSGWTPYNPGTFISYASSGMALNDERTCK